MPISPITSILRAATRKPGEPLNILTAATHESYQTMMSLTGHNFYLYGGNHIKPWVSKYRKLPDNHILLNQSKGPGQISLEMNIDLILSQNKFGQFQLFHQIANQLNVPLISLEHTLPHIDWNDNHISSLTQMRGEINVFISDYSVEKWKYKNIPNTRVIEHAVDNEWFSPQCQHETRDNVILSVVNDWVNRDWCCNFRGWQRISQGLPVRVLGDTPGLSRPANDLTELRNAYACSRIFLNTSTISPIPSVCLEAASTACAVVSTATCMIPEIFTHGHDALLSNDEGELRQFCLDLLDNPEEAKRLGYNARQTMINRFSPERFVNDWNDIFEEAMSYV